MPESDLISKINALVNSTDKIDWDKQGFAGIGLTWPWYGLFQIQRKAPDGIREIRNYKNIPDILSVVSQKASDDVYNALNPGIERRNTTYIKENFQAVKTTQVSTDVNRKPIVQQFYDALFCILSINSLDYSDKTELMVLLLDKLNKEIGSMDQNKVENFKKFASAIKANNSGALKYVDNNISTSDNAAYLHDDNNNKQLSFDAVFENVCENKFDEQYSPSNSIHSVNYR